MVPLPVADIAQIAAAFPGSEWTVVIARASRERSCRSERCQRPPPRLIDLITAALAPGSAVMTPRRATRSTSPTRLPETRQMQPHGQSSLIVTDDRRYRLDLANLGQPFQDVDRRGVSTPIGTITYC